MFGFGAPPGFGVGAAWTGNLSAGLGVMVRYQDSPALIVVLVVGYLGFVYCLLLLAQQQWGRSRLLLPKWLVRRWRRWQDPTARFMEDEL